MSTVAGISFVRLDKTLIPCHSSPQGITSNAHRFGEFCRSKNTIIFFSPILFYDTVICNFFLFLQTSQQVRVIKWDAHNSTMIFSSIQLVRDITEMIP